jgi:hypothetical protein
MRSLNLLVALTLGLSAECALAGDLLVDPGTGAPAFATIQAAVNAANVGDRIFVAPGLYAERVLITKGIELVGAGPTLTRVRPTQVNSFFTPAQPPITIQNVPAGQRVRVSGFECSSQHNGGVLPSLPMLAIFGSQGRTELSDLVLDHSSYSGTGAGVQNGTLLVFNCPQVIVERVRCTNSFQGNPSTGLAGPNGMAGAFVSGSKVWFNACELRGKSGIPIAPLLGQLSGNGGDGLIAVQSEVELARTLAVGASGSAYLALGQPPVTGGAGLRATNSQIRLIGGAGNQLEGAPAVELGPPVGLTGPAGVGAVIDAGSSLVRASDTAVAGGAGVGTQPPAPAFQVATGGQQVDLARRLPSLQLSPGLVQIGQALTVDYQGEPNSVHLRALWVSSGLALPLPGIGGSLLLDPLTLVQTLPVVLDLAGQAQVQSGIPNNPNYLGLCLVEQSAQVAGFDIDLGTPAILNVDF